MEFPSNISELANNLTVTALNASTHSELNLPYTVCEILVAVCAVFGNGLVIIVFSKEKKLRRRTNYYIISLATADLLVGLFAIPFAILASIGLPKNLHACLFTVSVLIVLCTISIFCLVAVSVDRYWAILHPMGYSRTVRTKTAIGIICVCWIAGTLVGFLPLLGWNAGKKSNEKCIFTEVMDYDYLVFLYFATIIFPALLIAAFYAHIYRVVVKQLQQIVTMNPGRRTGNQTTGTMLRLLGAARKREVKATQNLSRIVIFFIICWIPLYTINCVMAFCPWCRVNDVVMNFCIILSHLNSAGNPLLYAYHLKDFRAALKNFMWNLLFPHNNMKSSVVSVIHERGSLVDSQRQYHRQIGGLSSSKRPTSSLLRQVTDVRSKGLSVSRDISIRDKETGNASSSSQSDKQEDDNMSQNSNEFQRNESDKFENNRIDSNISKSSSHITSMELQTYKPLMPLLPAEIDNVEETPPASIFVIEVDVNHMESVHKKVNEELTENKDKG
ncbi:adenosine receptor A2b [Apis mellifera caucasica]|uniref:Adenosine receptor A2b n=1 Tax=Apis mellifera TaxID=7460 RepID=A0A7M7R599_APIME|nr:adenosine receptor A2b [Apis mellifera]KAG6800130.1 adenosine receptor A2b [Apis mellifera caucasica]KAG9433142.1 adenosine receptor A2b [Apis mellifera carnica]|eukprot:XP_394893.3 adenosine receptor A2b [Apis mellifera]